MSKRLIWDNIGEKEYQTGVDHGVLYLQENGEYPKGVVWNGLSSVTESPSGAEATPVWADNIKYLNMTSAEDFGATIEAYMCPREFYECDGSRNIAKGIRVGMQTRKAFGFSYRTLKGTDVDDEAGYLIHCVYGCKAAPSEKAYQSKNDSPEAMALSWTISTTPVPVPGFKPTAILTIDSTMVDPEKLKELEDALYGTDEEDSYLPLPAEIMEIVGEAIL